MSESTKIIKNTGYLYIKTFVSMLVMLYVTRVILQALGAEDFGIYNVVAGFVVLFNFLQSAFQMSTTQKTPSTWLCGNSKL